MLKLLDQTSFAASPPLLSPLYPGGHLGSSTAVKRRMDHLELRTFDRQWMHHQCSQAMMNRTISERQQENLDHLLLPGSALVVTGQQPGLLGGPLYWFYKALTAISYADSLRAQGFEAVPLFWVAGDDSDLRECNRLHLLEGTPEESFALPIQDDGPMPMSLRTLGDGVESLLSALREHWPHETHSLAQRFLSPKISFTHSFMETLHHFTAHMGLLYVDAFQVTQTSPAQQFLFGFARNWKGVEECYQQANDLLLENQIRPQLRYPSGTIHAFQLEGSFRKRLRVGDIDFESYATAAPPLSHDAFSRPIVMDALFPVVGHVLGPSEMRYFAQMGAVFRSFFDSMPCVAERMEVILARTPGVEALKDLGVAKSELPRLQLSTLRKAISEREWSAFSPKPTSPTAAPWRSEISRFHESLYGQRNESLEALFQSLEGRWERYLNTLKRRLYWSQKPKYREAFSEYSWLGRGMGQDRLLNVFSLHALLQKDWDHFVKMIYPHTALQKMIHWQKG